MSCCEWHGGLCFQAVYEYDVSAKYITCLFSLILSLLSLFSDFKLLYQFLVVDTIVAILSVKFC